jgi:hypothetical protein
VLVRENERWRGDWGSVAGDPVLCGPSRAARACRLRAHCDSLLLMDDGARSAAEQKWRQLCVAYGFAPAGRDRDRVPGICPRRPVRTRAAGESAGRPATSAMTSARRSAGAAPRRLNPPFTLCAGFPRHLSPALAACVSSSPSRRNSWGRRRALAVARGGGTGLGREHKLARARLSGSNPRAGLQAYRPDGYGLGVRPWRLDCRRR